MMGYGESFYRCGAGAVDVRVDRQQPRGVSGDIHSDRFKSSTGAWPAVGTQPVRYECHGAFLQTVTWLLLLH